MDNGNSAGTGASRPFLTDVAELRDRARRHIDSGTGGKSYVGDVKSAIEILQTVLATELVCVLRYTQHSITATGLASAPIKAEFAQHAGEEMAHATAIAERICQLGGKPNFNPEGLAMRSTSEYGKGDSLTAMIKENLIAERIAVEHYRELVRFFGNDDPTTRVMIETILEVEEEHANDMLDLLTNQGSPAA